MLKHIWKLYKKYQAGLSLFIGILLAVGSAFYFVYRDQISIEFQLLGTGSILEVHENVGGLDIIFDGASIKQTDERLSIYVIRIINNGQVVIRNGDYDQLSPLGITIDNGKIVDSPSLLNASNYYIKAHLKLISIQDENEKKSLLIFSPIIMESGEYFDIKFLVLHPTKSLPKLSPIGKVAGISSQFELIDMTEGKNQRPNFDEVFAGDARVQLMRIMLYPMAFIISVLVLLGIAEFISSIFNKIAHIRAWNRFYSTLSQPVNTDDEEFYKKFHSIGFYVQKDVIKLIQSEEDYQNLLAKYFAQAMVDTMPPADKPTTCLETDTPMYGRYYVIGTLIKLNLIIKRNNIWVINEDYANKAIKFYSFFHPDSVAAN